MRMGRCSLGAVIGAVLLGVCLVAVVNGQTPGGGAPTAGQGQRGPGCMSCHGDGASGEALRAAEQQYAESGHKLGFRTPLPPQSGQPAPTGPGAGVPVQYQNMMNEATQDSSGSHPESVGCQGCHTEQGFRQRLETGKPNGLATVNNPVPIQCFTCHLPHTNGDFRLVTTAPVASVTKTKGADGRTYDGGKGNLCAMCHRLTLSMPDGFHKQWDGKGKNDTVTASITVFGHQPMEADFMLGQGEWPFDSNYDGTGKPLEYAVSPHYAAVKDTCVGCHMKAPGPTNGMAGHTFFLSNYRVDVTTECVACHGADNFRPASRQGGVRFRDARIESAYKLVDYDGDGTASQLLVEIEGMRNTLANYFLAPGNFPKPDGSTPISPLRKLAHPDPPGTLKPEPLTSYLYYSDYRTNTQGTIAFTPAQAESFYNLRMFLFDMSNGIHNPRFAAQVLYDSIQNLNVNAKAGLKVGAVRP